ncbi:TetR/AcrR family transcriptional regulator [Reinekea sp.]|jgi:AcrR family transcriptional regulator|uniref:TetR/AcrR family transcriptional regulator n=1 Tax=Reinekea sp. TaxID=1970455 RepID=UPI002A813749|nr:TetR/AcrR family transcriptional regulator [Reinekea sp.]
MLTPGFSMQEQNPSETALITSALNLFIILNEDSISVTQLIKAAGISRSVFYKNFGGKDDVYAAILLTDELTLSPLLQEARVSGGIAELLEQYLKHRIQQIEKYRVLMRLEKKLQAGGCTLQRFQDWQQLRRQHADEFSGIIELKLARAQPVDRENIRFYYGLIWSLASGVAHISESDFFHQLILDRRGFTRFLLDSMRSLGDIK